VWILGQLLVFIDFVLIKFTMCLLISCLLWEVTYYFMLVWNWCFSVRQLYCFNVAVHVVIIVVHQITINNNYYLIGLTAHCYRKLIDKITLSIITCVESVIDRTRIAFILVVQYHLHENSCSS